jgi:hypothetical protein
LLNLKVGGIIPVYKTELGTLNVLLKGTTSLSYIGSNSFFSTKNYQIISASVGLNYMFNIKL